MNCETLLEQISARCDKFRADLTVAAQNLRDFNRRLEQILQQLHKDIAVRDEAFAGQFNQDAIGGAPFIGISRPVIKAHGSSNETAFMNAIRQAIEYKKSGMIEAIEQSVQHMTAE